KGVVASAWSTSMLKSIRIDPKPQPPAAASAWTMPSDVALFGKLETSLFHGLGASKSCPGTVVLVEDPVCVVVLGREVEVEEVVVVGLVVDVEFDAVLVVETREVEVLVVAVVVVVVFFRCAAAADESDSLPQTHAWHSSLPGQSAAASHCS